MNETNAILRVLEGAHPGNFFATPYLLSSHSEKEEADWLAAVPAGWDRFSRLLRLWFLERRLAMAPLNAPVVSLVCGNGSLNDY